MTDTKHCYHFPAKKVIGKNGFHFNKSTFLYFSQIKPIKAETINKKYIDTGNTEVLDSLDEGEYKEIVYCAYKGNQTPKRIKQILEEHLENIC